VKRTKIICTLGPSTDNIDTLVQLINEGMDVARLNFSHGNKEERDARIALIKKAREITGKRIPILLDTKGIKIRTGYVQGYSDAEKRAAIELRKGESVVFACDSRQCKEVGIRSTSERIFIDYDDLPGQIKVGQHILLDDGLIATEVTSIEGKAITAKVLNTGRIVSRRSVNLPGLRLALDALTESDKQDLLYGIAKDIDFVALSFVKRLEDVAKARRFLDDNGGGNVMIISKIENQEGVENIDEILSLSDGLMVARGDMAVEVPFERVPAIQKEMIAKALRARKVVITATQMLHSMMKEPTPTRAEVSDVFNAIEDLTACIMLSGETASGDYPVEAVRTMSAIALEAERVQEYERRFFAQPMDAAGHVTTSVCHAAVSTAYQVRAKAIVAYTESGLTAKRLSALRPATPLLVVSSDERVVRQCHMLWGVQPHRLDRMEQSEELYSAAMRIAEGLESGDNIVVVAGTAVGLSGSTNALRVMTKGDVIVRGTSVTNGTARGQIRICKDFEDAQQLKAGEVAVLYRLYPEFEPYLDKVGAILLAGTEYDMRMMVRARALGVPIVMDVQGASDRLQDGMAVEVVGKKGVVLRA
jgi:pyruvate kinase